MAAMWLPPSEPALGYLCTTQALEPCAGNPPGAGPGDLSRPHREKSWNLRFHNDPKAFPKFTQGTH